MFHHKRENNELKEKIASLEERLAVFEGDNHQKVAALLRAELGLIDMKVRLVPEQRPDEPEHLHYFYGKKEHEIRQQLSQAHTIYDIPLFREVINYLVNKQGTFALLGSKGRENDLIARGEMSGMACVLREFEALHAQYQAMQVPHTKFDDKEVL